MNDHDAMTAINAVLDQFFKGIITIPDVLHEIAKISGMNKFDHEEAEQ